MEFLTQISLAHYFYFLREDFESFKAVWEEFVKTYRLQEVDLKSLFVIKSSFASPFPHLTHNKEMVAGFMILENLLILEVFYQSFAKEKSSFNLWPRHLKSLEEIREKLQPHIEKLLGEATVLVSAGEKETAFSYGKQLLKREQFLEDKLKAGTLFFSANRGERRHFFIFQPLNSEEEPSLLISELPLIDAGLQKFQRTREYFQKQCSVILNERDKIDETVSQILHQKVSRTPEGKETISLLEQEIDNLSEMYGRLAGDMTVIKNACDSLGRDLNLLEGRLKRLPGDKDFSALNYQYLQPFRDYISEINFNKESVQGSLENIKAGMEVIRTRVELERGKESLAIQEEGLTLQIATGFIEFILVFYYSLITWKTLATPEKLEKIPTFLQGIVTFALALAAVFFTHSIAQSLRRKKITKNLIISLLAVLLIVGVMIALPLYY